MTGVGTSVAFSKNKTPCTASHALANPPTGSSPPPWLPCMQNHQLLLWTAEERRARCPALERSRTESDLKHFVDLRIRRSTCRALAMSYSASRARLPINRSSFVKAGARFSGRPAAWEQMLAYERVGWTGLAAPVAANSSPSCRETFQASIFSAYAPLSWRSSTWHGTTEHLAGLPQGRSFPDVYM
jgi:hypothetical protein